MFFYYENRLYDRLELFLELERIRENYQDPIPVLRLAFARWPHLDRLALVTRAIELASMDDDFDSHINRLQHPLPR